MKPITTPIVMGLILAAAVAAAPPPKPGQSESKPMPVPSGSVAVALPDLELSRIDLNMIKKIGTMPGGQPCWMFSLGPIVNNIGKAKAGPFSVVWERADTDGGNYVLACPGCTEEVAGAAAGAGLIIMPRSFNNCGGVKSYRVRVDPDNRVHESNENNNQRIVNF